METVSGRHLPNSFVMHLFSHKTLLCGAAHRAVRHFLWLKVLGPVNFESNLYRKNINIYIYIIASRLQVVVLKRVKPYQRSLLKAIFENWTIKMSVCQVELPRFTKTLRSPMRTIVVLIDQRHLTLTRHPMTILLRSLLYERYVVPAFCFIKTAHLFCSAGCCTWLEVINTAPERGKNIFSNS